MSTPSFYWGTGRRKTAVARIRLIPDGDIAGAISVSIPDSGSDILFGIGGTPEGVTAACALLCTGGEIVGRLWPRNEDEKRAALDAGYDLDRILTTTDLVSGEEVFFAATGISDGDLLRGVHYRGDGATTESLVMRAKSGTIRSTGLTIRCTSIGAVMPCLRSASHTNGPMERFGT